MTGEIELEGTMRRKPWQVAFDLFSMLEAMLETVDFLQTT